MDYGVHISRFHPGSAMSRDAIAFLADLVASRRYRSAVEFGPGLSSIVLLESVPDVLCVDEPGKHHEQWKAYLAELGLSPRIHCQPLLADGSYDVQLNFATVDLVVIDGPWGHWGRATKTAVDLYGQLIGPRTDVVIDDTHRDTERSIWLKLQQRLPSWHPRWRIQSVRDQDHPKRLTTFYLSEARP